MTGSGNYFNRKSRSGSNSDLAKAKENDTLDSLYLKGNEGN